jgi:hypothetical protein
VEFSGVEKKHGERRREFFMLEYLCKMGQPKTDETQFGMQWQKRKEKEKCGR